MHCQENTTNIWKRINIQDWLYVEDHCEAIQKLLKKVRLGQTYNIGGDNEIANMEIVNTICEILDNEIPLDNGKSIKNKLLLSQIDLGMIIDML